MLNAESGYAHDEPLRKMVHWSDEAIQQRDGLIQQYALTHKSITELEEVLSLDPRPAYQADEKRIYGMHFAEFEVKFSVNVEMVKILNIQPDAVE